MQKARQLEYLLIRNSQIHHAVPDRLSRKYIHWARIAQEIRYGRGSEPSFLVELRNNAYISENGNFHVRSRVSEIWVIYIFLSIRILAHGSYSALSHSERIFLPQHAFLGQKQTGALYGEPPVYQVQLKSCWSSCIMPYKQCPIYSYP